jgi:hypothetical protein
MVNNVNGHSIEKIYHFSFTKVINFQWGRIITVTVSLSFMRCTSYTFDRLDGFVLISNLVWMEWRV